MDRRAFQTGLLLSGIAGTAPLTAGASNREDGGGRGETLARVRLQLAATVVLLAALVIYNRNGFLGLTLSQPVPRYDENRVDLGRLPLLGTLQRPLLAERFARATLMGDLFLYGQILFLLPVLRQDLRNTSVVIAHRDESWEPKARITPLTLSDAPSEEAVRGRGAVGTAHLKGDSLLMIVRPSILTLDGG